MRDDQRSSPAPPDPPVIDLALARRLIDGQVPQWSHLPVTAVEFDGWDNRTFRLGSAFEALGDEVPAKRSSGCGTTP